MYCFKYQVFMSVIAAGCILRREDEFMTVVNCLVKFQKTLHEKHSKTLPGKQIFRTERF